MQKSLNYGPSHTSLLRNMVLIGAIISARDEVLGELWYNQTSYSVGDLAVGLALGDLNGDGAPDLIATDSAGSHALHIRLNDGDGGFGPASVLVLPAGQPRDVAVVDLDADTDADVVVAVREGPWAVLIYRNLGGGQLAAPIGYGPGGGMFSLAISDFNQDSFPDIAYAIGMTATKIGVLLNLGNGSFGPATLYPLSNPPITYVADVAAGDVTGDGMPDLVGVLANNSTVALFVNHGKGGFGPAQPLAIAAHFPEGVALGDLDWDGDLDLVIFEEISPDPDRVRVAMNNGRGGFANPSTVNVGHVSTPFTTPMTPVIADLDGDGRADIAVAQRVIINSPSGFGEAIVLAGPAVDHNFAAASADLNADGLADLAFTWHVNVSSFASVFLNLTVPPVLGDVTGDGHVNVNDLLAVINAWGPCPAPCPPRCGADISPSPNGDCAVNVNDLLLVINNWG